MALWQTLHLDMKVLLSWQYLMRDIQQINSWNTIVVRNHNSSSLKLLIQLQLMGPVGIVI